jgi:predicted deacylase
MDGTSAMPLQIGTARAVAGEIRYGVINVGETCDGAPIQVPLAIAQGRAPGPALWIQNGVHGTEYVGLGALQRILRNLCPAGLKGTLICLPMMNILAYRAGSRAAPQDHLDMNRVYPGAPLQRAMHFSAHSEIALRALFSRARRVADVLVDCHDGGAVMGMAPLAQYVAGGWAYEQRCDALARATGLPFIWKLDTAESTAKTPNSVLTVAARLGLPTIGLEVGGGGRLDEADVACMADALLNVMRYLGMLGGKDPRFRPQHRIRRGHRLRPSVGGVLWNRIDLLERVARGQVVQVVTDLFGRVKQEIVAPVDGVVIARRTRATSNTGEYCSNIGELE